MHKTLTLIFPDTEYPLPAEQSVIAGRADTCEVRLDQLLLASSSAISREHFKLFYDKGFFFIVDLHSYGGTKVNQYPLTAGDAHRLEDGDCLEIAGGAELTIRVKISSDKDSTQPLPVAPQLAELTQRLHAVNHLLLLGVAGTGKTTLLNKLVYHPETQAKPRTGLPEHRYLVFFYVNCMAVGDFTPADFFGLLIAATKPAFYNWPTAIRAHYQQVMTPGCSLAEIQTAVYDTVRIIHDYHKKHVVFMLDQFDDVYLRLSPDKLFPVLKNLQQHFTGPKLTYVFAMRNPFEASKAIHQFLRETTPDSEYWMPPCAEETLRAICATYDLSEKHTSLSLQWGGGQPRLTELIAATLGQIPDASDEAALMQQLLSNHYLSEHCQAMWRSLRFAEQEALLSVQQGAPRMLYQVEKRLVYDKWLLHYTDENFRFASPLFGAYVRSLATSGSSSTSSKLGVRFDSNTQKFIVDEQPVPHEDLSKLEYDMLLYLYKNAGRVCSRYDISENVWDYGEDDAASNAMIASVISRLRKKLNEKSPGAGERYIISVRGQGYKCVVN